jgi:hypothetical protein
MAREGESVNHRVTRTMKGGFNLFSVAIDIGDMEEISG